MNASDVTLDLGCGLHKQRGAIGVDNVPLATVDVMYDLRSPPYPFRSECANEIILSHVLEHFDLADITRILEEVWRILKTSGSAMISVPHAGPIAAFTDPTHKSFFTFGSFYYFTSGHGFSYYQATSSRWHMNRIWASVNVFNNQFRSESKWRGWLNDQDSRIMRFVLRRSKSYTLPEVLVKLLPFWLVSIHCRLVKDPL